MDKYREIVNGIGVAVDLAGVAVIVIGIVIATCIFLLDIVRKQQDSYRAYRQSLGRAILLGLEFLVGGDIIRTVVVSPTLENVFILGLIVLIRTFLSMAMQLELEGRLPWQRVSK